MPKQKQNNTERIMRGMWYTKDGYVHLSKVTEQHFIDITRYWFNEKRPQIIKKIKSSEYALRTGAATAGTVEKNARRTAIISLGDYLISEEIKRRHYYDPNSRTITSNSGQSVQS